MEEPAQVLAVHTERICLHPGRLWRRSVGSTNHTNAWTVPVQAVLRQGQTPRYINAAQISEGGTAQLNFIWLLAFWIFFLCNVWWLWLGFGLFVCLQALTLLITGRKAHLQPQRKSLS